MGRYFYFAYPRMWDLFYLVACEVVPSMWAFGFLFFQVVLFRAVAHMPMF